MALTGYWEYLCRTFDTNVIVTISNEMKTSIPQRIPTEVLKDAAIDAFNRVIDPLLKLIMDVGVTMPELNRIVRERAVHIGLERVIKETGRESKARIAIATGLPRSEVAKILRSSAGLAPGRRGQHPARRLLDGWHDDRRFVSKYGDPAVLPIFGTHSSFERLVSKYVKGTPVRAMLDELIRLDAVERLSGQRVKVKSRFPILTGLERSAISMVGERGGDLLETLTNNIRAKSNPLFEATALIVDADPQMLLLIQREVSQQGASFVSGLNSLFNRSRVKQSNLPHQQIKGRRIGVTAYYFQDPEQKIDTPDSTNIMRRTNLRRRPYRVQRKFTSK